MVDGGGEVGGVFLGRKRTSAWRDASEKKFSGLKEQGEVEEEVA